MNPFEHAIKEWILENGINDIADMSLITEMRQWADDWSRLQGGHKALRVYTKCMLNGKFKLAKEIEKRYGHIFPKTDRVIAAQLALLASQKQKEDK